MASKWIDGAPTKPGVYTCEIESTEENFVDTITGVAEPDGYVPGFNTRYGVIPMELIVRHRYVRKAS